VLFILDTSGSIGSVEFERMKTTIARLPGLFCRQVKFAAITFDHYIHLEFCFDCFESTYDGRTRVSDAIKAITYRGGLTYTGSTAKCVCEEILDASCGIEAYPDCLDVVFITDGHSNDPAFKICDEIECLHSRLGVDTYAIGIKNYDKEELDCITDYSDLKSAFEFESFAEFEMSLKNIVNRLAAALPDSIESCARLNTSIATTGSVPFG
jgi:uncharacterized protein with von Willebrand factor type A (vWA) domain